MCNECAAAPGTLEAQYDRLVLADEIVSKALGISELSQMARYEQRLRQYINKKWDTRREQAAKKAGSLTKAGKTAKQVSAAVGKIMNQWSKDVTPRFNRDIASIYKLARKAGMKKGKKKSKGSLAYDTPNFTEQVQKAKAEVAVSFDLADQEAIAALAERNTFWIGTHYDENISAAVAETSSATILEAGASRSVAAVAMVERIRDVLGHVPTPGGFNGTSVQYFEGLTSNAATVARAFGQMRSFGDIGITRYTIANPQDSRTCKVCSHMDGKVFNVEQGYSQMSAELGASSPDDIKQIHPWMNHSQLTAISSRPGAVSGRAGVADSRALAAAGLSLPPFHFRCRCAVDVDASSASFGSLSPMAPPTGS